MRRIYLCVLVLLVSCDAARVFFTDIYISELRQRLVRRASLTYPLLVFCAGATTIRFDHASRA